MKSIYLTLALLFTLSTFAQKKNINGKIYDKHPAIDLVDQFTSAFVKGDSGFAEVAVPFWAGAQTSNANLGRAFADSLK